MGISSVANKIGSAGLGMVSNLKPAQKLCRWFKKDPVGAIATSTIASVVIKDGVGCAMYVYQSMHNDKIPEKRRKFVAALDLTNGILMIASQIAMFFAMRQLNEKLFHKLFNKSFDKLGVAFKSFAEQIRVDEKAAGLVPSSKRVIRGAYKDLKDASFATFKFVTELAAATIGAKRILVPFIATPLASKVEKLMNKNSVNSQEVASADNFNPSMKGNQNAVSVDKKIEVEPVKTNQSAETTNLFDLYMQQKK